MDINHNDIAPGSPEEWYDLGVFYRKNGRFGEAINAFMAASESPDEALRAKALASIDLIREINGFVNADLMNP